MGGASATPGAPSETDAAAVRRYLEDLHDRITAAVEAIDTARFRRDAWQRPGGGGGESRVLSGGDVFERAGVSFSHVTGDKLPQSASNSRPEMTDAAFVAMGLSLVFHPRNPFVPTTHCNVRFLRAAPTGRAPIWWFGGGFDLTPYYPFEDDVLHWHRTATRTGATGTSFCLTATRPAVWADCSSTISTRAASSAASPSCAA
jgi:coproporphyrinogen III oxidase